MNDARVVATFWNESMGRCECCGQTSKSIWGDLSGADGTHAVYFVHWTVGTPAHHPTIDLVLGQWGEGASPGSRVLVSLEYRPGEDGGAFMVINGEGRSADNRRLCGRALSRDEVIGTPLATQVFTLIDALWLTEPRVAEVRALEAP
jgi:hypothetical protein